MLSFLVKKSTTKKHSKVSCFSMRKKKVTLKLDLSSSSNLEVSDIAQHVPSRTASQILNDLQNRKQLKVAAQDPLLHRPTLGLHHQGRYRWFLLCYCSGMSQLDYLVAKEHPWYSSKKALSLLVQICPLLDFVVMHKHSFYKRRLLQTSKYLSWYHCNCFLKSQIARNCSGLQKTPCEIFHSGEYKDMDLKHCLHMLTSWIAAEPSAVTFEVDQVLPTRSNDSHRLKTSILQIPRMWWQADVLPCVLTFFQQRGWYLSHFLESYAAVMSKWLLLWREVMRTLWQKRRCGSSLALLMFRSIADLCRLVVPMATSINIDIHPGLHLNCLIH